MPAGHDRGVTAGAAGQGNRNVIARYPAVTNL